MSNREYLEKIVEVLEQHVDDNKTVNGINIFAYLYQLVIRLF